MLIVTGANGFLGSYLVCTLLKQGHKVMALKRSSSSLDEFNYISNLVLSETKTSLLSNLVWEDADLLDVLRLDQLFEGAEMVFHTAAKVSFNGNRVELFKVNGEGTANVVNACLKAGVKKLIYASSTAALGRVDGIGLIDEETQWVDDLNNTMYAESKHLAELEVWRGVEEGLDAVVVNPGIILGAGAWKKGSCRLFDNISRGLKFYTNGVNGFIGVENLADIMVSLAFSDVKNERFVVVAENLTYKELFDTMAEGLGVKAPSVEMKASYLPWASILFKINGLLFKNTNLSPETLRTSVKIHRYNSQKIISKGYELQPIKDIVFKACEAYKQK
jgi:nucleoside-diphosphate-sugar epimerase